MHPSKRIIGFLCRSAALVLTGLLVSVSASSCACYRSFVEADFEPERVYGESGRWEVSMNWDDGSGYYSKGNPTLMIEKRSEKGGELSLGFSAPVGRDSRVVLEELSMVDRQGHPVATNLGALPVERQFEIREFVICHGTEDERKGRSNFAAIEFQPEVSFSGDPYKISVRGYYRGKDGAKQRFAAGFKMKLRRERSLEQISNCWP